MFELAHKLKIELAVFFNGPYWSDAEFFRELNECKKYLQSVVKLEKGQYFYEDCFATDAQHIIPGAFVSQLWALSNYKADFSDMTSGFAKKVVARESDKHGGRGANRTAGKQCIKCRENFQPSEPHHKMCRDCNRSVRK